jgi:peptide deformylase
MKLKIADIKNPCLYKKSKPVSKVDKKITKLIADMWETLKAQKDPEGVGLAAPQVGKNLQVFIVFYGKTKQAFINPQVISKAPRPIKSKRGGRQILEGCLSLPHYYSPIKRANKIAISYLNEAGQKQSKKFTGFLAHIIQHELDHLAGKVFVDHTLKQKLPLYKIQGDEWEEVDLI